MTSMEACNIFRQNWLFGWFSDKRITVSDAVIAQNIRVLCMQQVPCVNSSTLAKKCPTSTSMREIYERLRAFFSHLSENKNFVITFTRIIFFAFFWLKLNLLLSLPKVTHKREELRSYKGFWKKIEKN